MRRQYFILPTHIEISRFRPRKSKGLLTLVCFKKPTRVLDRLRSAAEPALAVHCLFNTSSRPPGMTVPVGSSGALPQPVQLDAQSRATKRRMAKTRWKALFRAPGRSGSTGGDTCLPSPHGTSLPMPARQQIIRPVATVQALPCLGQAPSTNQAALPVNCFTPKHRINPTREGRQLHHRSAADILQTVVSIDTVFNLVAAAPDAHATNLNQGPANRTATRNGWRS